MPDGLLDIPMIGVRSRAKAVADGPPILVIDDDPAMTRFVGLALEKHGYHVTLAQSARDGLAHLDREDYVVIITDLFMPEQDGFDVLREVRRRAPTTRVLVMSGHPNLRKLDYLRFALTLGADAVLRKPFRIEDLLATLAQIIDGQTVETAQ